jgi:hypothetical protein
MCIRTRRHLGFALAALWLAGSRPIAAQTTANQNVELEPITCFWRTSSDAVRLGEPFTLVLTCGVLDTAATTVVPDRSRLDPGALQLQPFDVRGGSQAPDVRTPTRRFFQYEYQLRYVGEEVGKDLQLPALTLTYRVQSRVQLDGAAVESRERQYILPAHTIRILSTVPQTARDIRDASPVTLADIDARRFRASMLRVAAWGLYAVGAIVVMWGLARTVQRRRARAAVVTRHATDSAILAAAVRELGEVRRARGTDGWSEALAARALAPLRVAASYDAGSVVIQTPAAAGTPVLSGQLRVAAGWPRSGAVLVSGAATGVAIARVREAIPGAGSTRHARLEDLESVLARFSEAAYGRDTTAAMEALDDALASGERAAGAIHREHSWLRIRLRDLQQRVGESVRARGWARS